MNGTTWLWIGLETGEMGCGLRVDQGFQAASIHT